MKEYYLCTYYVLFYLIIHLIWEDHHKRNGLWKNYKFKVHVIKATGSNDSKRVYLKVKQKHVSSCRLHEAELYINY